jgi:hypothetical protein
MATKKKSLKKTPAVDERKLEEWKMEGKKLKVSEHQWAIADWILRGEKILKSKEKAYDEAVKHVILLEARIALAYLRPRSAV